MPLRRYLDGTLHNGSETTANGAINPYRHEVKFNFDGPIVKLSLQITR